MNVYDFSAKSIKGVNIPLSKFKGKVLLIVNTATHCGYTKQYNGLQTLYQTYQTKGLEILMKKVPSALIVPISINNSWKTLKYGKFPMGFGANIIFTVHKPLKLATFTDREALIKEIESTITASIHP